MDRVNRIKRKQWSEALNFIEADRTIPIYLYFNNFYVIYHDKIASLFFPQSIVSRFEINGEVDYENTVDWYVKDFGSQTITTTLCHFVKFYSIYHVLETHNNHYHLRLESPFGVGEMFWYLSKDTISNLSSSWGKSESL